MALTRRQFLRSINRLLATRFRWISLTLVTLIVVLGYYFFLSPKITEIRRVGNFDLRQTNEKLELKRQILTTTQELRQRYEELNQTDMEKLRALLPDKQQLPELFVQVEALANASNLRLSNVGFAEMGTAAAAPRAATEEGTSPAAPAAPKTRLSLKRMSVTFSVSGGHGYGDVKNFLTIVESSIRLLDVQSLSYSPGDQEQYQINAVTYYLQ